MCTPVTTCRGGAPLQAAQLVNFCMNCYFMLMGISRGTDESRFEDRESSEFRAHSCDDATS